MTRLRRTTVRQANDELMTNDEISAPTPLRHLSIRVSFVVRGSDFVILE
jgi:hypothetical protein